MDKLLELWLKFQGFIENNLGISMDTFLNIVLVIIAIIKKAVKFLITLIVIAILLSCGSNYLDKIQEKYGVYIDIKAKTVSIEMNREDPDYRMNFNLEDKTVIVIDNTENGENTLYTGKINSTTVYDIANIDDKTYISIVDLSEKITNLDVQEDRAELVSQAASTVNTVGSVSFGGIASDIEGMLDNSLSMDQDSVDSEASN